MFSAPAREQKPWSPPPEFFEWERRTGFESEMPAPILSVFSALIVHSELKSVHPGFPVAFIF